MTEQELRAIVREAVERHLQGGASTAGGATAIGGGGGGASPPRPGVAAGSESHASHLMFLFTAEPDNDGRCIIEPVVACTHCGYCKSYGH